MWNKIYLWFLVWLAYIGMDSWIVLHELLGGGGVIAE